MLIGALLASLGFITSEHAGILCKKLTINIEQTGDNSFINENEIQVLITEKQGQLIDLPINSINTKLLERLIVNNPFVEKVAVYSNIGGELCVDIKQRRPIVRIIGANNNSYYIDEKGVFMPLSDDYTARVTVANGDIYESYAYGKARIVGAEEQKIDTVLYPNAEKIRYTLKDTIYTLAKYIDTSAFWKAQIQEIYINAGHDIELMPTIGNHRIILGRLDNINEKFLKLMVFYKEGLNIVGWDKYKTINIKYSGQVVCTK